MLKIKNIPHIPEYSLSNTLPNENLALMPENKIGFGIKAGVFKDHSSYSSSNLSIKKASSANIIRS